MSQSTRKTKPVRKRRLSVAPARTAGLVTRTPKDVFVALDFETADYQRDSACSIALVRVEGQGIVDRRHFLIRPPRQAFVFTYIHGISWRDVANEPQFKDLWPEVRDALNGVRFIAAHSASFDAGVLRACCYRASVTPPVLPFVCTMKLARRVWGVYPTKLPDVCRHLGVALNHHNALSDAEACAKIVIAAMKEGARVL